jgi:hypothetical protein
MKMTADAPEIKTFGKMFTQALMASNPTQINPSPTIRQR